MALSVQLSECLTPFVYSAVDFLRHLFSAGDGFRSYIISSELSKGGDSLNTYLLRLCSYHQPRRVRVIENVLVNHRTVANLFWAQQYGVLNWLGARRRASQDQLDAEFSALKAAGLIELTDRNEVQLTPAGVNYQETNPVDYQPHFFDWYWLANTNQVQQRLLLGFQVVSEFAYHNREYVPLNVSFTDQQAVKGWFRHYYSPQLTSAVYSELHLLANSIAGKDPRLAPALVNLLIGHEQAGWTVKQLGAFLKLSVADALIMQHDLLLAVSAFARQTNGPLANLLKPLLLPSPLSRSNLQTVKMFQQGNQVAMLAHRRQLKLSTVREHLLTAAILMPQLLDWSRLLPKDLRDQLARWYTGPVTTWQFNAWTADANADFFYFRLYQIYQGSHIDGG